MNRTGPGANPDSGQGRALSARAARWQSRAWGGSPGIMKTMPAMLATALAAMALNATLSAAPVDAIGTLAIGRFACELPGDALGPAGVPKPEADFAILNASAYRSEAGGGSYLLVGDVMTFTSGPRKGEQYRMISNNFLRRLNPDGSDGSLRCVRRNRSNR